MLTITIKNKLHEDIHIKRAFSCDNKIYNEKNEKKPIYNKKPIYIKKSNDNKK
jgi:hypothetical protein